MLTFDEKMNVTNPIHPMRRFQIDTKFHAKCEAIRAKMPPPRAGAHSGQPAVYVAAHDVVVTPDMAQSFKDVQGSLYMHMKTLQEMGSFVRFWDYSRQIFSFERPLAEALSHTEVSDVPWEALKLPYESFYIHFGPCLHETVTFENRSYKIDGAYVNHIVGSAVPELAKGDVLEICFTAVLLNMSYDAARSAMPYWMSLSDPQYECIMLGGPGITIGEAIAQGRNASLSYYDRMDDGIHENAFVVANEMNIMPDGTKIAGFRDKYLRGERLMSEALPLLFNCIFYLSYSSLDIAPEYPPDAPKSLVEKIAKTPSTNRKRILTEKMERLGYTKIRFVSHAGLTSETNAPETDRTIRSHWRRGHWRLQRHGPQLQFFKLLWIKPTVVNPANDPPKVGRQYNVNKKHVESGPRD